MAIDDPGLGSGIWAYLFIAVACLLATDLWRVLGVVTSTRLDENSEVLKWVRAVSTALVAGFVSRIVAFPVGAMAETPLAARLGALALGVAVYFLFRRSVLAGILAGEALVVGTTIYVLGGF